MCKKLCYPRLKLLEKSWLDEANNGYVFADISDDEDTTDEEPTEGQRLLTLKAVQIRYMIEYSFQAMSAVTCFFMVFVLYTVVLYTVVYKDDMFRIRLR